MDCDGSPDGLQARKIEAGNRRDAGRLLTDFCLRDSRRGFAACDRVISRCSTSIHVQRAENPFAKSVGIGRMSSTAAHTSFRDLPSSNVRIAASGFSIVTPCAKSRNIRRPIARRDFAAAPSADGHPRVRERSRPRRRGRRRSGGSRRPRPGGYDRGGTRHCGDRSAADRALS